VNAYVSDRKPIVRIHTGAIVRLAVVSLTFNIAVLAMLLFILFDLAPRTGLLPGREYEQVRIAVELLSLVFVGAAVLWAISIRRLR
jgi:hypothetical protein